MTEHPTRHIPRRFLVVGIVVAGLTSLVALAAMIAIAVAKVRSGEGLETYRTHWMVQDNWIGFLVFVGVAAVALLAGFVFRWRDQRQLRALERKYGEGGGRG